MFLYTSALTTTLLRQLSGCGLNYIHMMHMYMCVHIYMYLYMHVHVFSPLHFFSYMNVFLLFVLLLPSPL